MPAEWVNDVRQRVCAQGGGECAVIVIMCPGSGGGKVKGDGYLWAASTTARYPARVAMLLRTSYTCARVLRGMHCRDTRVACW